MEGNEPINSGIPQSPRAARSGGSLSSFRARSSHPPVRVGGIRLPGRTGRSHRPVRCRRIRSIRVARMVGGTRISRGFRAAPAQITHAVSTRRSRPPSKTGRRSERRLVPVDRRTSAGVVRSASRGRRKRSLSTDCGHASTRRSGFRRTIFCYCERVAIALVNETRAGPTRSAPVEAKVRGMTEPADTPRRKQPLVWPIETLVGSEREAHIRHAGQTYRLRITAQNRLILTK